MKNNEQSSILKEALTDFNAIMEAADANAKKKLAEEFPEKFEKLLKESLSNKNTDKESYKKIDDVEESQNDGDESEVNKEPVMENETKKAGYVKTAKVGDSKPFGEKEKNVYKDKAETPEQSESGDGVVKVNNEKRVKDFTGDVESKTPNLSKGDNGIAFKMKPGSKSTNADMVNEEFDITELGSDEVETALNGLDEDDEIITLDDIENEIREMDELGSEIPSETPETSNPQYQELIDIRNKIDEMIKTIGGVQETEVGDFEADDVNEHHLNTKEEKLNFISSLDDEMIDSLYRSAEEQLGMTESMDDDVISDDEIDSVLDDFDVEDELDEVKINTHSAQKQVSNVLTQDDMLQNRKRYSQQEMYESKVKIQKLIEENRKLTKKINESKKNSQSTNNLLENYKTALAKYRDQLKEMAVFNTNLAHVNNLLVNEDLALTYDDKVKIINEFKRIDSIVESQKSYKKMLSEMIGNKKPISENIEDKVSTSIQPSSKKKLDEAIEKTAYENNEHIGHMKRLIEYVEKRGKKL